MMNAAPRSVGATCSLLLCLACAPVVSEREARATPHGDAPLSMSERESLGLVGARPETRCLSGQVTATGPLGAPQRDVAVCLKVEQHDGGRARTDERGQFQWCISRQEPSLAQLFWSGDPMMFRDRIVHIQASLCEAAGGTTARVDWSTAEPLEIDLFLTE